MTKIEWARNADGTAGEAWNPLVGCSLASPGCTNCYAMKMAARVVLMNPGLIHYSGLTEKVKGKAVWTGAVHAAPDHVLTEPLHWKKPRTVFVCSMSDLFHPAVPDALIDRVFAVMALCPQHTFQVLTKRSPRMRAYFGRHDVGLRWAFQGLNIAGEPMPHPSECVEWTHKGLPNVWLGVSAEDQKRADERIPDLLATPAAVRFVSAEPLLGPIRFDHIGGTRCLASAGSCCGGTTYVDALRGIQACERAGAYAYPGKTGMPKGLDWIIVGGESGPGARPMSPDWARDIRDQCADAGTAFFFKQWGAWAWSDDGVTYTDAATSWGRRRFPAGTHFEHHSCGRTAFRVGKKAAGRELDGRTHDDMPERCAKVAA